LFFLAATVARTQTAATLTIQADQPGAVVSSNLFGIFFEEINFAGEGGIYAETVRNRSFYNPASALFWTLVGE
jgi:alpha-L-arabinofuranosidase